MTGNAHLLNDNLIYYFKKFMYMFAWDFGVCVDICVCISICIVVIEVTLCTEYFCVPPSVWCLYSMSLSTYYIPYLWTEIWVSFILFVYILEISYDHDILTIVYCDLCKVQISFGSYFNAGQPNHFFFSSSFSIWLNILIIAHPCTVKSFLPTMELQMWIFLIITFKSFMMNILFV